MGINKQALEFRLLGRDGDKLDKAKSEGIKYYKVANFGMKLNCRQWVQIRSKRRIDNFSVPF